MTYNTPPGFVDPGLIDETIYDFTDDEVNEFPEETYEEYYRRNFPNHLDTEDKNFEQ